MIIDKNKYASITYSLKVDNAEGEVIETIDADRPLEFIFGIGNLLPAFEENLSGLGVEDKFAFTIPSGASYGEYNDAKIVELKTEMFAHNGETPDGLLDVGNQVPMQDGRGNKMTGTVKEVVGDTVIMDFNHPLAGKTLFFEGAVQAVREATYDELNPPEHSCGCGSGDGSCSTDGGSDHECGCEDDSCDNKGSGQGKGGGCGCSH